MIQVEVTKNKTESTQSLIRRFTKKMQGSGLLKKAKKGRYHERPMSEFVKKKNALKKIEKKKEIERLYKLGKIDGRRYRRSR